MLLDKKACTTARNDNGETPMYKAVKSRKRNIENLLRSYGMYMCVCLLYCPVDYTCNLDIVTKAIEMCKENAFKNETQSNLAKFKLELDSLGRNFHHDCANSCLLYFAKRDMHKLSAKCIVAGADNFEQAILFAEKTNSIKTLSQLLLSSSS